MPFVLTSTDGQQKYELRDAPPMLVGRAPTCDIPVFDPTISRRHAEVSATPSGAHVRDLGSSNGTFVNGDRIADAFVAIASGDVVTFGKVAFRLTALEAPKPAPAVTPVAPPAAAGTIVRQMPVKGTSLGLAAIRGSGVPTAPNGHRTVEGDSHKNQEKLETLLEVLKGLGKSAGLDALLEKIAGYAYQVLDVDRVAIQLVDDHGTLIPKIARDKKGSDATRSVPQSIVRSAIADKVAILSDNAGEDTRFGGQSILMQQIRSAVCCPLMGAEDRVLGVLYVDNVTATHRFSGDDFEFCVAFAGIAAVAIENEQFAQRIQRELLVRSSFERYFAPALAERIASDPNAAKLGGDKVPVAVLFSDIRGFTALSETMAPDAMATLLTEYFTDMVECVFRNGGTLDKFIGDAVMAQWGAPIHGADDADRAMAAALEMMRDLDLLNQKWRAEGKPVLQIGIGLNYGECFAGNIGSERRMEFTVIGDTVNTASRLCGAADGGEILVSGDFRSALAAPPRMSECPPMELKNKSQPVPVYRIER
jgi:adenylate cyclase